MSFGALVTLALASAAAMFVLLYYLPIHSTILGISYSPRIFVAWFFPLLDVIVTIYMIGGSWFGVGHSAAGIGMVTFSISTALGLSAAALAIRKFFVPRWRKKYQMLKSNALA